MRVYGTALDNLSFGRVVYNNGAGLKLASPAGGRATAIVLEQFTPAGQETEILPLGSVESADWTNTAGTQSLTPGANYFLQADGKISTNPPTEGAIIRVGHATSATVLIVTFSLKVVL